MKYGLVMEGGAMRGMFTCGVIDVFMENGITFDGAIGVSAGAAFGCNYKSRQIGRAIRYNKRFCRDPRFSGLKSLLTTGNIYNAEFDYHIMPNTLDIYDHDAFVNNPMEFWVVCTDIETGKPVYHQSKDTDYEELEWIRASASMPMFSTPVCIDGQKLLDGGISDSVPLRFFESIGYHRNVVILTQPADYRKTPNKLMPLVRIMLGRYPNTVRIMKNRHLRYNKNIRYCNHAEKRGRALIIRPEKALNIKSIVHDPQELQRVYELGRRAGEKHLNEVKIFLRTGTAASEKHTSAEAFSETAVI